MDFLPHGNLAFWGSVCRRAEVRFTAAFFFLLFFPPLFICCRCFFKGLGALWVGEEFLQKVDSALSHPL